MDNVLACIGSLVPIFLERVESFGAVIDLLLGFVDVLLCVGFLCMKLL